MAAARVLVVDDDPIFLEILSRGLTREGYEVLPASEPRQALEIVRKELPIDLILSDLMMPEMPGTDLVREISLISPWTAGMLMTAGVIDSANVPEGVLVLRKPFSTRDLISGAQAALERSARAREDLARAREKSRPLGREARQLQFETAEASRRSGQVQRESARACSKAKPTPGSTGK